MITAKEYFELKQEVNEKWDKIAEQRKRHPKVEIRIHIDAVRQLSSLSPSVKATVNHTLGTMIRGLLALKKHYEPGHVFNVPLDFLIKGGDDSCQEN